MRAVYSLQRLIRKQAIAVRLPAGGSSAVNVCCPSPPKRRDPQGRDFFCDPRLSCIPLKRIFGDSGGDSASLSAVQTARRTLASQASSSEAPSSSISFQPEEVSRRLVELAEKYCKEGSSVSASQSFDSLETREERPWDCLDTVEFVLDAEDIFGIVIPDEAADAFEKIQDVVDYIVSKAGKDGVASSA